MMSPRWAFFLGGTQRSQARIRVPALVALLPLCMPLTAPPPGVARVGVEMIGYAQRTEPVALHPDRTTSVVVAMSPKAIELEPIVADVRSPRGAVLIWTRLGAA